MKTQRSYLLFSQTLNEPLQTSKGMISERRSLVLRELNDLGQISFGEVSPLPGFSEFDLGDALKQAKKWVTYGDLSGHFSLLEPALGSLHSGVWNCSYSNSFLPPTSRIYKTGKPFLGGVIKRKIGFESAKEEIPTICKWLDQLHEGVSVRLDPNERFSRDEFQRWVDAICNYPSIQFVEQPTSGKDDEWLIDFSSQSPVPIGLDEALIRMNSMSLISDLPRNLFLVIKPVFFSDWERILLLVKDRPDRTIISTSFETPFGYEALIRLASNSKLAPGLDRSCFFGHPHEFSSHHQPRLQSPTVTVTQLEDLWVSLIG